MPVVINEFEVVPESPAPTTTSTPAAGPEPASNTLTVLDLERLLRHLKERQERIRAH